MAGVGRHVAALHDGGLVHGDLTTSNLLVRAKPAGGKHGDGEQEHEEEEEVVVIDFGLATNSGTAEDKAVDLFVLERALTAAHAIAATHGVDGDGASVAGGPAEAKHGPAAHCPDALFAAMLAAYRQHCRGWRPTLAKFAEVRLRGRKRSMVG
jgi:TP53 regulating kinase-like protein